MKQVFEPAWSPGDLASWLSFRRSPKAGQAALEQERELGLKAPWFEHLRGFEVYDRRDEPRPKRVSRGRPRHPVSWEKRRAGTTVHQTGSGNLHENHSLLLGVPVPILVHQSGAITLLHYLCRRMPHAHALNDTPGIEVDCRVPGVPDDPSTVPLEDKRSFWRSSRDKERGRSMEDLIVEPTERQLEALDASIRFVHAAFCFMTPPERHSDFAVFQHCQARKSRINDGGYVLARRCDRVRRELGLRDGSQESFGNGTPQPRVWTAA